jgi:hypothetical protein
MDGCGGIWNDTGASHRQQWMSRDIKTGGHMPAPPSKISPLLAACEGVRKVSILAVVSNVNKLTKTEPHSWQNGTILVNAITHTNWDDQRKWVGTAIMLVACIWHGVLEPHQSICVVSISQGLFRA